MLVGTIWANRYIPAYTYELVHIPLEQRDMHQLNLLMACGIVCG
jgi:hypothetical protein